MLKLKQHPTYYILFGFIVFVMYLLTHYILTHTANQKEGIKAIDKYVCFNDFQYAAYYGRDMNYIPMFNTNGTAKVCELPETNLTLTLK